MQRLGVGACAVALLIGCGSKKPDRFTVGVTLGTGVGNRLDGVHMTLLGQDAVLDSNASARYVFPASTPPLAGQSAEILLRDTPCGDRKIAVPLGITAAEEEYGRAGNADVSENIFKMLDLAKLGLAPAPTSFYIYAPDAKTVAIGKHVLQAPIPKTVTILDADCGPLQVSIDGAAVATAPKDVPPMKEPDPARDPLDRSAVLISADPKLCFAQRTYAYGAAAPTPDSVTFNGSNLYKLTRVWYDLVLEPHPNWTKSSGGASTVLTAIQQVDCD